MTIIAITGGRDVHPSQQQLDAFARYLDACRCGVLRHGDCEGVDLDVAQYVAKARPSIVIEAWSARWYPNGSKLDRTAGPRRNRVMLKGDAQKGAEASVWVGDLLVESQLPRVDTLVHWPGGRGTDGCVELAATLGIPTVPIGEIVRAYLHPLPARRS